MNSFKYTNSLIHARSPYLLQHAHNPVNWQEWSDEIPEIALKEDKLILISIGYSSCHWCHVMEHECFEDEDTAAIMNSRFICVKVDREERPDLDQVYMDAVQLLTGQGGWPLNVFTLPNGKPLHGGTYFPKNEWNRVLISLSDFYLSRKPEAEKFAEDLANGIRKLDAYEGDKLKDLSSLTVKQIEDLKGNLDPKFGGFNRAPKFPLPNQWELFMTYAWKFNDNKLHNSVKLTLRKMYEGGIFDHLAGGFSRYSTDSFWLVPHFEKMLYDNAQLMELYSKAYGLYKDEYMKDVIYAIHNFIKSDLSDKECRFYSALDADSEGEEGRYYIWSASEINQLLESDSDLFCSFYQVTEKGNWEHGKNILHITQSVEQFASSLNLPAEQVKLKLEQCRKILLENRKNRTKPGLDDKIICSWNALMISGYVAAYRYTKDSIFLLEAEQAMHSLLDWCYDSNQLYRIFKDGISEIEAFAEDYACLIKALTDLFEVTGKDHWLLTGKQILEQCIDKFYDADSGLFYFTSSDQKVYIARKKDVNDDVIPSSNSILCRMLTKYSLYFDNFLWEEMAQVMSGAVSDKMERFPFGFSNWMIQVLQKMSGLNQILITGSEAENEVQEFRSEFQPFTIWLTIPETTDIPLFTGKKLSDAPLYYKCTDRICGTPFDSKLNLLKSIGSV